MLSRPRLIYDGVSNSAPITPPIEDFQVPESSHTPLFLIVADRGDYRPTMSDLNTLSSKYGIGSLTTNPLSNHHIESAIAHLENGGVGNILRLKIAGATKAIARLSIVVDAEDNDSLGYYFTVTRPTTMATALVQTVGSKTTYPIFDIQYKEDGTYGNNIGFDIQSAINGSRFSLSLEEINQYITSKGFPCVVKMVERQGSQNVTLAVGTGTVDGTPDNVLMELNRQCGNRLNTHTYADSIWALQQTIFDAEETFPITNESTEINRPSDVDIFGHTDQFGIPYQSTYPIDHSSEFILIEGNPFFLSGGSNGLPTTSPLDTLNAYDDAVSEFLSIDNLSVLVDPSQAPFRSFYDSGFSLRTKLRLFNLKKVRPEITLVISAYSVADYVGEEITPPPSGISCDGAEDELFFTLNLSDYPQEDTFELTYEINGVETVLTGLTQTNLRDRLAEIPGMEAITWESASYGGEIEA